MTVTQVRHEARWVVTVAQDPCPQLVVQNHTATALMVAEPVATENPTNIVEVTTSKLIHKIKYKHISHIHEHINNYMRRKILLYKNQFLYKYAWSNWIRGIHCDIHIICLCWKTANCPFDRRWTSVPTCCGGVTWRRGGWRTILLRVIAPDTRHLNRQLSSLYQRSLSGVPQVLNYSYITFV